MKKIVCVMLFCVCENLTQGATIVDQLGDEDGFASYDNPSDNLPRSQVILDLLAGKPLKEMDQYADNTDKGWTHTFTIPNGHTITGATLRMGFVESGEIHDGIPRIDRSSVILDPHLPSGAGVGPSVMIGSQPGYVTPPAFTSVELFIDLSQVLFNEGWNNVNASTFIGSVMDSLNDGEFNVWGISDSGLDYSILTVETIPEPTTLILLASGLLALRRRKIRRSV